MAIRDTEVYEPITEAELAEWEARARTSRAASREFLLRLIAEVRRLRTQLSEAPPAEDLASASERRPRPSRGRRKTASVVAIVRDPEICGGSPTLAGTRIGVHDVVGYAHHYGGDLERVRKEALPDLSGEQIRAAWEWYNEHRQEIDDILRRRREHYERGLAASRASG